MSPAEAGATRRAGTGPQQQSDSRRVNEMGENKSKPLEQESQTVSGCAPAQSQAGVTPECTPKQNEIAIFRSSPPPWSRPHHRLIRSDNELKFAQSSTRGTGTSQEPEAAAERAVRVGASIPRHGREWGSRYVHVRTFWPSGAGPRSLHRQ